MFSFESITLKPIISENNSRLKWFCPISNTKFALQADTDAAIFDFDFQTKTATHINTFPALAYIRNSKREASLVEIYYDFSYCAIVECKRYLYIYINPKNKDSYFHYVCDLWQDGNDNDSLVCGMALYKDSIWVLKQDSVVLVEFH